MKDLWQGWKFLAIESRESNSLEARDRKLKSSLKVPHASTTFLAALLKDEVLMIAVVASATFAILDMYAPTIGHTARQGAGFGIGAGLVGFPGKPMF